MAPAADEAEFSASGTVIRFAGFLRAYVEGSDDEAETAERDVSSRPWSKGDTLSAQDLEARSHTTQPPARYTEASLVKALEELGVGRPSTYASILGTIQNRGYVWKKGRPSCRRSRPSPWWDCSSGTSATSSTTASPPPWRTTSTRSPRASRRCSPG